MQLDNNNDVLTDLSLFTLPHTSGGLTSFISTVFSAWKVLT